MPFLIPFVGFVITGVLMVVVQSRYIRALADRGTGVQSDDEVLAELMATPGRLPRVMSAETKARLRAMYTRQTDPALERMRLVAFAATVPVIACLLWFALG